MSTATKKKQRSEEYLEWRLNVKIALLKRDMTIGYLAKEISRTREYTTNAINTEDDFYNNMYKIISDYLKIPTFQAKKEG